MNKKIEECNIFSSKFQYRILIKFQISKKQSSGGTWKALEGELIQLYKYTNKVINKFTNFLLKFLFNQICRLKKNAISYM